MQIIYSILLVISIILVMIFAVQNADPVPVNFLVWEWNVPLSYSILFAALLGSVISLLVVMPAIAKAKWLLRKQNKRITELEANSNDLKVKLENSQVKIQELETQLTPNSEK